MNSSLLLSCLDLFGEIQERDDEASAPCCKCGEPTVHRARLWDVEAGFIGDEIAVHPTHDVRRELKKVLVL